MFPKSGSVCEFGVTLCTLKSESFMNWLYVSLKIAFRCCLVVTLCTLKSESIVYWFYMLLKMQFMCWLIVTNGTRKWFLHCSTAIFFSLIHFLTNWPIPNGKIVQKSCVPLQNFPVVKTPPLVPWCQVAVVAVDNIARSDVVKLNEQSPPRRVPRPAAPRPHQSLENYRRADTLISINFPERDWLSKLEEPSQ